MNMWDSIIKSSLIGLATIDASGRIDCCNPAFCDRLGIRDASAVIGRPLLQQLKTILPAITLDLEQALASSNATYFEFRLESDVLLTFNLAAGDGTRLLVIDRRLPGTTNTTFFENSLAYQDSLTGLGNRLLLDNTLREWQHSDTESVSIAVIMIDLDRFKQVNDTLGHSAGDELLKLVAKRIKSATRSADTLVRMGGDEFVILHMIGDQPVGAESVGRRIVELMSRPFLINGQQVNIGASVGIAILNCGTEDKNDLLRHADLALYEAKAAGRGNVKFFEPALAQRALERRNLEIDLRRALGLKEFQLVYQPQVDMKNGCLLGFEALIRWQSNSRGMISPAEFIPLAEELGEIHAIGEWALRMACKEAMSWEGEFTVAVNVSPVQFENNNIVNVVRDTLAITGLPPHRLELEITEGVMMSDYETAQKYLWEVKNLGVGIAMDDFGTGYSSLSYLNSFPFSKIKIDQSFVRGEKSEKSKALVQAIISLGASLKMTTIAEGVETREQYDELAKSGCLSAQGYLISRPIPPHTIPGFISNLNKSS